MAAQHYRLSLPSACHNRAVLSSEAVTIRWPSGLKPPT